MALVDIMIFALFRWQIFMIIYGIICLIVRHYYNSVNISIASILL